MPVIREMRADDASAALSLNNAAVPAVNAHDPDSFAELTRMAERCWVVDDNQSVVGLLVAFAPGAAYQSANYVRLAANYDRFCYVDRIVIAPSHHRLGLAANLYETLAGHALALGRDRLLCEVNVEPPNPQSVSFHEANGWIALHDHEHSPGKSVRYFERVVG